MSQKSKRPKKTRKPSSRTSGSGEKSAIDIASLPVSFNPALQTVWVDRMAMLVRANPDAVVLRFYSALPEMAVECARLQTSVALARNIIDVLARNLDYYPTKPDQ